MLSASKFSGVPSASSAYCRRSVTDNWGPAIFADPKASGLQEDNAFQYVHPTGGAVYTQHGMLKPVQRESLTVYQKRPFLTSEYYNSGCSAQWCNGSGDVYPSGHPACSGDLAKDKLKKIDPFFASIDPYISNAVPTSMVCYKGITPNSTAGWIFSKPAGSSDGTTVPLWSLKK